jgi:hypothetical protein
MEDDDFDIDPALGIGTFEGGIEIEKGPREWDTNLGV